MARPYSQDLRDRVVAAVAGGRTCRATAALFGVSVASVVKWSQRWRATGSVAAKPMGGRRPLPLTGERAWLLARIAEKPDLTPAFAGAGSCERWWPSWPSAVRRQATGRCGAVSPARGLPLKKSLHASEQDRVDIARRRARWKMHQGRLDPRRLVFRGCQVFCVGRSRETLHVVEGITDHGTSDQGRGYRGAAARL